MKTKYTTPITESIHMEEEEPLLRKSAGGVITGSRLGNEYNPDDEEYGKETSFWEDNWMKSDDGNDMADDLWRYID